MSVRGQIDKILATFEEETRNEIHRLRQENDTLRRKLKVCELQLVPETEPKLWHVVFSADEDYDDFETTVGIYTSLLQAHQAIDRYIERMTERKYMPVSSRNFSIETLSDIQKKDGDQLFVVQTVPDAYREDEGEIRVFDLLEKAEKYRSEVCHKAFESISIKTVIVGRDEALMALMKTQ